MVLLAYLIQDTGINCIEVIQDIMPSYNCTYLGDNARAPYGERSFDVINQYTSEA